MVSIAIIKAHIEKTKWKDNQPMSTIYKCLSWDAHSFTILQFSYCCVSV